MCFCARGKFLSKPLKQLKSIPDTVLDGFP